MTRKILIVDDSEANRLWLKTIVESLGFTVDVAKDGKDAIDLATGNEYALILMDVYMPVLDGRQATRGIAAWQEINKVAPTPIVAMTAGATAEECIEAGMNGYLRKPTSEEELTQFLEDWFAQADTEVSGGFKCTVKVQD